MDINNIENRTELAKYFVELGFMKGAEIGVEQGVYSKVLCEAGMELYAVDAWSSYSGYRDHVNQKKLDGFYEKTKELLAPYDCHIIKGFSMDVVKDFEDENLDFIYLDANHNFINIAQDIWHWSKKVRKGGIVAGHDYVIVPGKTGLNACHVKYIVDAWVKSMNIELHVTKERTPSWFYIKK